MSKKFTIDATLTATNTLTTSDSTPTSQWDAQQYLKTASVNNDKLTITKQDDTNIEFGSNYELIEKIIVGYSITTSQPETGWYAGETLTSQDLNDTTFTPVSGTFYSHTGSTNNTYPGKGIYYYNGTNYQSYYTNTGTAISPTYSIVTTQQTWTSGTYYAYSTAGVSPISRSADTTGTAYAYTGLLVKFYVPKLTTNFYPYLYVYEQGQEANTKIFYNYGRVSTSSASYFYNEIYRKGELFYEAKQSVANQWSDYDFSYVDECIINRSASSISSDRKIGRIWLTATNSQKMPSGAVMTIYAKK